MTLTLGWWIIPTLVTILAGGWFATRPYSGGLDPTPILYAAVALIVTLFAWLAYFASLWILG